MKIFIKAFSLAEMLMVLLIMSFLVIAMTPLSVKKAKKETTRQSHGVFECYYNDENKLTQKITFEGEETTTTNPTDGKCVFDATASNIYGASFFLVSGVGGGGGGAFAGSEATLLSGFSDSKNYRIPYDSLESYVSRKTIDFSSYNDNEWRPIYTSLNRGYSVKFTLTTEDGQDGTGWKQITYNRGENTDYEYEHPGGKGGSAASISQTVQIKDGTYTESILKNKSPYYLTIANLFSGGNISIRCEPPENGTDGTEYVSGTKGNDGSCFMDTSLSYTQVTNSTGNKGIISVTPTEIQISRNFSKFANWYGAGGEAGEAETRLFPKFRNSVVITIGQGGAGAVSATDTGTSGGDTTLVYSGETTPFFTLRGGLGGGSSAKAHGQYYRVMEQKPYYLNDTDLTFFQTGKSSSMTIPEGSDNIPEGAGSGGNGGFTIFRKLSIIFYRFFIDGSYVDLNYPWADADDEVTVDGCTGTDNTYCSGKNGTNGALVIVW